MPDIPPRGEDVADCLSSEGSGVRKLEDFKLTKREFHCDLSRGGLRKKIRNKRRAPGQIFDGIMKNVT